MVVYSNGGMFGSSFGLSDGVGRDLTGTYSVPMGGVLEENEVTFELLDPPEFPLSSWSPQLRAQVVLYELMQGSLLTSIPAEDWKKEDVDTEIAQLIAWRNTHRSARHQEIVGQMNNPEAYWYSLLKLGDSTKPATMALISVGMVLGTVVSMGLKNEAKRPRPSEVYPALMPSIPVPPHPSFPSGHALQAYLIEKILSSVVPSFTGDSLKKLMTELALRIAVNREIAGVHYASDKKESRRVAELIFPRLAGQSHTYDSLIQTAIKEWSDVKNRGPLSSVTNPWEYATKTDSLK